jgi:site-specific DNA-methyltransferase (adenine-specific)
MRNENMIEQENPQCVQAVVTGSAVFHGDCLEIMKSIPEGSIDMILCDLPYGTTACKWDILIPFENLWKEYNRVIKDNGAIVLTASQPFTTVLINSNLKMFKYCWVWNKRFAGNFVLAKYQPQKIHEDICVFSKKTHQYIPQMTIRDKPIKMGKNRSESGSVNLSKAKDEYIGKVYDKKYPESIIEYNVRTGRGLHPTQKPVALFEYLIKTYTNAGNLILDNCAGSGTTAIACINTNRKYILIEKEQKYFDIINERIEKHNQLREGEFPFENAS